MSLNEIIGVAKDLKSTAMDFVVMQVVTALMVVLQFNILGYYHGAKEVALYGLLSQIYIVLQMPFVVLFQPMWTRFVVLLKENRLQDVLQILKQYYIAAVLYSVVIFVTFYALEYLLPLVSKDPIKVNLNVRLLYAFCCFLGLCFGGVVGSIVSAMGKTRSLMQLNIAQLTLFLLIAFLFTPTYSILGIVLAVATNYLLSVPYLIYHAKKVF